MTTQHRLRIFSLITLIASVAVASLLFAVADYVVGRQNDLAAIRLAARTFRSEIAPYALHVSAMVPNIHHEYDSHRGSTKRLFRTDDEGLILGSSALDASAAVRILFLGGSTTENNEVNEPDRFPYVAQELLRSAGIDAVAMNAGVRGHTTQDSIVAYLSRPGFRTAQYVVLMHNINDRLWLSQSEDYSTAVSRAGVTTWNAVELASADLFRAVWDFASYRSNVLFAVRQRLTFFNPWTGEPRPNGAVTESNLEKTGDVAVRRIVAFENNLRVFVSIVRTNGGAPVLMTQPLARSSSAQQVFNEKVREVARAENALLIDLEGAVGADANWAFLGDGIHYNDDGSRFIGTSVANSLAGAMNQQTPEAHRPVVSTVDSLAARCRSPTDSVTEPYAKSYRVLGKSGRYPSMSPDGSWLIFQAWADGREKIFAQRLSSGEIVELSPQEAGANERHPAVISADTQSITFVFGSGASPQDRGFERLLIRQWPSMATRELLADSDLGGSIPNVHGNRITFAGFRKSRPEIAPKLMAVDVDGSRLAQFTTSRAEEWRPAVAPDGEVFFISNPKGNFDLFAIRPGENLPRLMFESQADEWDPAISPDGRWIAFASKRSSSWDIMLMERESKRVRQLTSGASEDWDPYFHPDGRLLLFAREAGEDPGIFGVCAFGEKSQ